MNDSTTSWLNNLDPDTDLLYVTMDDATYEVENFVVSSRAKKGAFIRDNQSWVRVPDRDNQTLNDVLVIEVTPAFADFFDKKEAKGQKITLAEVEKFTNEKALTAAGEDTCPPATQDIATNLTNRENAIKTAAYGPLNPAESNDKFWQAKASRWSVTIGDAKKSLCDNCAVFVVTTKMRDCIASGLEQGGSSQENAWDAIDVAELGYCEAFDFKCAASRTCDAWVAGGPIADDVQ